MNKTAKELHNGLKAKHKKNIVKNIFKFFGVMIIVYFALSVLFGLIVSLAALSFIPFQVLVFIWTSPDFYMPDVSWGIICVRSLFWLISIFIGIIALNE